MIDKITLSIHDITLKERIKKYALENGITVSTIVENYFKELLESSSSKRESHLPEDLDKLLNGIVIKKEYKEKSYKELRNKMYDEKIIY